MKVCVAIDLMTRDLPRVIYATVDIDFENDGFFETLMRACADIIADGFDVPLSSVPCDVSSIAHVSPYPTTVRIIPKLSPEDFRKLFPRPYPLE